MMAKTKKVATPEEVLQESEYLATIAPFQIPENWCWTTIERIANVYTGNSINEQEKNDKYSNLSSGLNYIATKDIGFDSVIEYENGVKIPANETKFKIAPVGSTLLCIEGGSAGKKIGLVNQDVCFVNKLCCFDFCQVNKEFYYYYLQSEEFLNYFYDNLAGLIGGVSINKLKQIPVILPPINEQIRIAAKIGSMFKKLDEAKELIQQSIDNFADRRAAILHKAFSGELTEGWRTEEFMWREVDLDSVSHSFQYGTSKKSEKDGKCVVIRMGNLQNGKIDWTDLAYSNDDEDIEKYRLEKDDVLFNRTNSADLVGKTSIFDGSRAAIFAGYLIRINYNKNLITGPFLNYLLNSPSAREYCSKVKSDAVNQSNINAKKLAAFRFSLPSIPEQQEIVRILDNFFEKEDKTKELLDMLDKIDEMKKAILSRAFRGELGTNAPDDEPAINQITQPDRLIVNACEEKQAYSAKRRVTKIAPQIGVVLKSDMERTIVKQFAKRNSNTLSGQILLDSAPNKIALVKAIDNMVDRRILKRMPNNMFKMEKKK